jgi:hypothetical protein
VLTLLERFETHHPHDRPHHYLSLLGTHPEHRGQGKGMALLAENLAQLDELGMPAYLESSNRPTTSATSGPASSSSASSRRRAAARRSALCGASQPAEQRVREAVRRLGGLEDEIGRAAEQRLDLHEVGEDLRRLRRALAVAVSGPGPETFDEKVGGRGQQHAVVERQRRLLLRAAREEELAVARLAEQRGDPVRAPAPAAVGARLAEAVLVGVERAAAPAAGARARAPTSRCRTCR